jgi:hypothetical protein
VDPGGSLVMVANRNIRIFAGNQTPFIQPELNNFKDMAIMRARLYFLRDECNVNRRKQIFAA